MSELLRIEVAGTGAASEDAARQVIETLRQACTVAFDGEPEIFEENSELPDGEQQKGWQEKVMIVLMIPSFLVSTIDLANKCDFSKKVDGVIEAATEALRDLPAIEVEVRFRLHDGRVISLDKANGAVITDAISAQQKKGEAGD